MKTNQMLFPLALAVSSLTSVSASGRPPVVAYPTVQQGITGSIVGRGVTRGETLERLGEPSEKITRDVWVYWGFYTNDRERNASGYDSLVLWFKADRISDLRVLKRSELEAFLEARRALRASSPIAANQ